VLTSPACLHVYEFNWSPDSKALAYVAADPPGENNWKVAKLYTQVLGGAPKAILAPAEISGPLHGFQIALPRWSPDGKAIAFIGGLMSNQGATGGDVWIIPAAGGQPRDLTEQRPTSSAWIEWEDNDHLFLSELAGSNCQLMRFHLEGDRTSPGGQINFGSPIFSIPGSVGDGRLELSLSSTADHSLFVFNASTSDHPWEIYGARPVTVMTSGLEGVMQLSHLNDGVEPAWGKSVSLSWKSDKFRVLGWLMLPKDYDSAKKYPLIVEVHGGPPSAVVARWGGGGGLSAAAFSALGYFVLQPNPRGSYGQGEDFTQANRKDFGDGEVRGILAGVDAVEAKYPVDTNRVGLTGWSYGGFKTMLALTQAGPQAHDGGSGRSRRRVSCTSVLRLLARASRSGGAHTDCGASQQGARLWEPHRQARGDGADRRVVRPLHAAGKLAKSLLAIRFSLSQSEQRKPSTLFNILRQPQNGSLQEAP
jgi:dipeptidyl aminopeptidase/acylaminoacyl peptidase